MNWGGGGVTVRERRMGEEVPELSLSVWPLDLEDRWRESCQTGLGGLLGVDTGLLSTLLLLTFSNFILAANNSCDTGYMRKKTHDYNQQRNM